MKVTHSFRAPGFRGVALAAAVTLLAASPPSVLAQDSQIATQRQVGVEGLADLPGGPAFAHRTDAAGHLRAPLSPGDSELGDQIILIPQEAYRPLSLSLAGGGSYTSNAALTDGDELDDFLWRAEAAALYMPHLTGNLFGELSARYEFYRYQDNSRLDFDSLEAGVGLNYIFRNLGDLSVWGRYEFTRLTDARDHKEIFTDHGLEAGFLLPLPLTSRLDGYVSHTSHFSLDANPGHAQYNEYSFIVGAEYRLTDRLSLTPYYEFSVLDYHERGREDLTHNIGLAATAKITDNVEFVLSGAYTVNDSNLSGGDFEVGNVGALLGLNIRF